MTIDRDDPPDWMKQAAASIPDKLAPMPEPPEPPLDLKRLIEIIKAANDKMELLDKLETEGKLDENYADAMMESVLALIEYSHTTVAKANKK